MLRIPTVTVRILIEIVLVFPHQSSDRYTLLEDSISFQRYFYYVLRRWRQNVALKRDYVPTRPHGLNGRMLTQRCPQL